MTDLKYPIGGFVADTPITAEKRATWIEQVERCPQALREAVSGLDDGLLETPYRPGGWTVRQLVHHMPDSHLNAYTRFRLALTENNPTIRPYDQDGWSRLADARSAPIDVSIDLLDALHRRWAMLLESLTEADWKRTFQHPEIGALNLEAALQLYAWHGRHHVAHITSLRSRMGW